MTSIKCTKVSESKREVIARVITTEGEEELAAPPTVFVGTDRLRADPIDGDSKRVLVELPRETVHGNLRVWVKREDFQDDSNRP